MGTIQRKATGTETLSIANCPCCGGDVSVGDCGYSSFNPGWAKCSGNCKREWKFESVDDEWDAGKRWNELAGEIRRRLRAFALVKVDRKLSVSRDFAREDLEDEAQRLLGELEASIIGASE